ncbi:MAG: argininosuccinate lyase [Armatimonadetes bacterium]|nr:argininosuccinate lyase [Armatimonadota bacterium]
MKKLWGGAFTGSSSELADRFGQSVESDLAFWREDVEGSIAHARMLGATGIIKKKESALLVKGLKQILREGPSRLPKNVEDVHTAVEVRLHKLVGGVAGKLHTARSRNDQVATDTRLYLLRRTLELMDGVKGLQGALLGQAAPHRGSLIPGVTHQQHAQPITLGFHLLAHFWSFQRHGWRLENLYSVCGYSPLGAAALAGTPFPVDRGLTSDSLGFEGPIPNALDATSDRSYVLDALHVCALLMLDLSRMAQETVMWSSPEFGWVSLPESMTTGSSIMPQKRNPDMAELVRGRAGRAVGNWVSLATTMKGLVMGYNRDTQDDKPPLFSSLDLCLASLELMTEMVSGSSWDVDRMAAATRGDFSTATDLADYLAREGMAFREAHLLVGRVVRACVDRGIGLEELTPSVLREIAPSVPVGALKVLKPRASVKSRESEGGTGPRAVAKQLKLAGALLGEDGFASPY